MTKTQSLRLCVAVASLAFACAAASAHRGRLELGQSGYWSLYAYFNSDESFGHCGIETGSKAGTETFMLSVSPRGFDVLLTDANWSLKEGDKYKAVTIIGEDTWTGRAVVISSQSVMMTYAPDSGFGARFASGDRMLFAIGDFERSLNLEGSSKALQKLAGCFKAYMPSSNPFGEAASDANPFE